MRRPGTVHRPWALDRRIELAIQNADLGLLRRDTVDDCLTDEQRERRMAMFRILIALFERAHILLFAPSMSVQRRRQWATWEDYMAEWCRRDDFRRVLPELLEGEDPAFVDHLHRIAIQSGVPLPRPHEAARIVDSR